MKVLTKQYTNSQKRYQSRSENFANSECVSPANCDIEDDQPVTEASGKLIGQFAVLTKQDVFRNNKRYRFDEITDQTRLVGKLAKPCSP